MIAKNNIFNIRKGCEMEGNDGSHEGLRRV